LVREAGGTATGLTGDDDALASGHIVCGNETIHDALIKILRPFA
jgi:myo-inositol-1(or 4)-monophosphatase